VRNGKPTPDKLTRMRSGLEAIVTGIPVVRQKIEDAYRDDIAADALRE
jgi:hypothetical protein